jgi:hypothetical protein
MSDIAAYLEAIKLKLVTSRVVADYQLVKERITATDGYLRIRATLHNGDFLEEAEYFERAPRGVRTVDYRYQWMDSMKEELRRRWDSTPDHPELPNFPYHVHQGSEENVISSQALGICQVLDIIADAIFGEKG